MCSHTSCFTRVLSRRPVSFPVLTRHLIERLAPSGSVAKDSDAEVGGSSNAQS